MKGFVRNLLRRRRVQDQVVQRSGFEPLEGRRLLSTYYASPSGSDSAGGTLNAPFASLSKAVSAAKAGDTIILRDGTYNGNVTINKPNITLQGYVGEDAKITSPTSNSSVFFGLDLGTEASGTVLRNLDISGGYYYALKTETTRSYDDTNAIYHGASNILIENVKLHDSGTHVVKLSPDSDHVTFRGCEVYNSGRRDANQGQGIDAVNVDDLLFEDNYIHDTTQNAIFVKGGSQRCLIQDNRIDNSGYSGILLGQDTDAGSFDTRQNPDRYEAIDCTARGNVIVNSKYSGIGTYSAKGTVIENNEIRGAAGTGQAGIFFSIGGGGVPGTDATVRKNIIQVNAGKPAVMILDGVFTGTPKFSNNDYYTSNRFEDDRSNFSGTLSQWQAKGLDAGSTYTAGAAPLSGDVSHDGKLNIRDYVILDSQLPLGKTGSWWTADANLDGTISALDYIVLDSQMPDVAQVHAMTTDSAAVAAERANAASSTDDASQVSDEDASFLLATF
jgi:parallel beta-helix repeat protein